MVKSETSMFCWGDRHQPTPVLDQTDTHVLVRLDGADRRIPKAKIVGCVQDGQRVQCLVSGGRWLWGTARDRKGVLWVELDCGRSWIVSNARWLKVQLSLFAAPNQDTSTLVPLPELEDYEEDELAVAQQYDLLEPLKTGDRVRVVLAGKPLEHLLNTVGTIRAIGLTATTPNLVFVQLDSLHTPNWFRRESLDLIDATEHPKKPFFEVVRVDCRGKRGGLPSRMGRFW